MPGMLARGLRRIFLILKFFWGRVRSGQELSIQFIERNFGEVESEAPGASHLEKTG
jgi:hypothetical protein